MGLWLNEEGDCTTQIERKSKEIMGEVTVIRNLGSKANVGELYMTTRLLLYEACIVQALLYQLEAWNTLKKDEIAKLESSQGKILCILMEVPKSTPYWGLLHETGIWAIKWRLAYRKIMLYHNIRVGSLS